MEYEKLKAGIEQCPKTFIGALLIVLLERAASIPIFKVGGLTKLAEKIEKKYAQQVPK